MELTTHMLLAPVCEWFDTIFHLTSVLAHGCHGVTFNCVSK